MVLDHGKWLAYPTPESLVACALIMPRDDFSGYHLQRLDMSCCRISFRHLKGVEPANDAPPGHGILVDDSSHHMNREVN